MFLHLQMHSVTKFCFLICVYFSTHFTGEKINFSHQNCVENSQALVFLHGTNNKLNNFLNFFQECKKKKLYIVLLIDFLTLTATSSSSSQLTTYSYLVRQCAQRQIVNDFIFHAPEPRQNNECNVQQCRFASSNRPRQWYHANRQASLIKLLRIQKNNCGCHQLQNVLP